MITPERYVAKDGRHSYKVRFRLDGTYTSMTFDTIHQARHFAGLIDVLGARAGLAQLDVDTRDSSPTPTLDTVAADHIRLLTGVEEGTRLSYQRLWARTWGELLGSLPANHVDLDRISEATINLAKRYSAKSLKNQRGLLSAVCARAVDRGYLTRNPVDKLKLPRSKENEQVEMRLLTDDEIRAILEEVSDHYRPLLRFLADTGARWGEAAALHVAEVALTRKPVPQVHIRQALKWSPDNDRTIGPTKTAKSNRWLPLTGQLSDDIARLVAGKSRNDLVFTAPRGGPIQHRTFWSDIWLPALQRAGIEPPRPRLHDLRHSFASRALGSGASIYVVQRLMGHQHISTTADTYGHLLPDALSQAIQAMEAVSLSSGPRAISSGT